MDSPLPVRKPKTLQPPRPTPTAPPSPSKTAKLREYHLRGGGLEIFKDAKSPECLISGAAGTGKSVSCLLKIHYYCQLYPGTRALVARKTRKSLTESGLVTLEAILGEQRVYFSKQKRDQRHSYDYPNGSSIVVGGMDDPTKIMSTDYDLIYIQESIELTEDDWESLTTRLRNGKLPFQQIMGDTNPSFPTHWLKVRCNAGRTKLYQSYHEDNPKLHDGQNWTPQGAEYVATLDRLTGARKERLRFGRWVQAEGVVYDNWDERVHLIDNNDLLRLTGHSQIPDDWPRYVSIDFGFRDPCSILWFAKDGDGRLYLYREVYQTGRLVEDHARFIKAMSSREPPPLAIICDPEDREGRETISRYTGMSTTPADKQRKMLIGIQLMQSRLCVRGDGRPRFYVMRDSLVYRDRELKESKRPTCFAEEIQSYVWRDADSKEEPEDRDNHAMDASRYACVYLDLHPAMNLDVMFIG